MERWRKIKIEGGKKTEEKRRVRELCRKGGKKEGRRRERGRERRRTKECCRKVKEN